MEKKTNIEFGWHLSSYCLLKPLNGSRFFIPPHNLVVRFWCKIVNLPYLVIKEYLLRERGKGNERWCTWERVVLLARPRSWGISIRTRYPLCLKKLVQTSTPAPGRRYRLTLTLCQPLSLSYFGCPRAPFESSTGSRLVIIVSPKFHGRGGSHPS